VTDQVKQNLIDLGWMLSAEKCHLIPEHTIQFLGWELDLTTLSLRTTRKRRAAILTDLHTMLQRATNRQTMPVKHLAAHLGKLNFLRTQIPTASLYMVQLNATKNKAVRSNGWTGLARLTPAHKGELKRWLRTLTHNTPHAWKPQRKTAVLTSDASPWGWGATWQLQGEETYHWGHWSTEETKMTSNQKELTAVLRAMEAVAHSIPTDSCIIIRSDNTAATHALRRWRGQRARTQVLRQLANLLHRTRCTIEAQYLPGVENETADKLSRMGSSGDYELTEESFSKVKTAIQQELTLDAFANRQTKKLSRYYTIDRHDPEALGVDGLRMPWDHEVLLLHPPPALILPTIKRMIAERPTAVLIIPDWRGQSWFPLLETLQATKTDLGPFQTAMRRSPTMQAHGWLLPPGRALAITTDTKTMMGSSSSTSWLAPEDYH
jgi:ribonuclease HI